MKKRIKILAFILVAVCVTALLCACGDDKNQDYVYFQNDTGVKVSGFYISSVSAETWGDSLNLAAVSAGAKIHIDPAKALPEGPGVAYDIGVLAVRSEGEDAIVTVTDVQGNAQEYVGWYFPYEE